MAKWPTRNSRLNQKLEENFATVRLWASVFFSTPLFVRAAAIKLVELDIGGEKRIRSDEKADARTAVSGQ